MGERSERWQTLEQLDEWLRTPMLALSLVWLVVVVVELTGGGNAFLAWTGTAIWILFIAEFLLRFTLAPRQLPLSFSKRITSSMRRSRKARVTARPSLLSSRKTRLVDP